MQAFISHQAGSVVTVNMVVTARLRWHEAVMAWLELWTVQVRATYWYEGARSRHFQLESVQSSQDEV